jgi:hypothetical protein
VGEHDAFPAAEDVIERDPTGDGEASTFAVPDQRLAAGSGDRPVGSAS